MTREGFNANDLDVFILIYHIIIGMDREMK